MISGGLAFAFLRRGIDNGHASSAHSDDADLPDEQIQIRVCNLNAAAVRRGDLRRRVGARTVLPVGEAKQTATKMKSKMCEQCGL